MFPLTSYCKRAQGICRPFWNHFVVEDGKIKRQKDVLTSSSNSKILLQLLYIVLVSRRMYEDSRVHKEAILSFQNREKDRNFCPCSKKRVLLSKKQTDMDREREGG